MDAVPMQRKYRIEWSIQRLLYITSLLFYIILLLNNSEMFGVFFKNMQWMDKFLSCFVVKQVHSKKRFILLNCSFFYMQVTEARSTLKSPQIHNAQFERGAKFWCHFCVEEKLKHMELDTCTVKYGGLIEHISRYFIA